MASKAKSNEKVKEEPSSPQRDEDILDQDEEQEEEEEEEEEQQDEEQDDEEEEADAMADADADAPSDGDAAANVKDEPEEAPKENDDDDSNPHKPRPSLGGASPGKIFVGGLPKEMTLEEFTKHFGKYGEITDSVIMKDRNTGHPRGFGFVTFADTSVVDKVILDSHVFGGKTVEIKRTIPKGAIAGKDFKTKKIFVGGIPSSVTDDEFQSFFAKFGAIKEHQIMRDHSTNRSRGFGFITFADEEAVDDLLIKGNKIEFAGAQVEIKKAEPKKPNPPSHFRDARPAFGGGFRDAYGAGGFAAAPYMSGGGFAGRPYGGYPGSEFDGGYGGYGAYRGESSLGYSAGFGRDYDMGGYEGQGYAGYGAYDSGLGSGYGSVGNYAGGGYASRRGYGGTGRGRFHPYGR